MNTSRRQFVLGGILIFPWMLSGCLTNALMADHEYDEYVSGLLVSQDKKSIVVISDKYHYIFITPPHLLESLDSPIHPKLSAGFYKFHVDPSNNISGAFDLFLEADKLTDTETSIAQSLGFNKLGNHWGSRNHLVLEGKLSGIRYDGSKFTTLSTHYRLNHEYLIHVVAEQSRLEHTAKLTLTPVTVATDGVLILGSMVLFPILLPELMRNPCTPNSAIAPCTKINGF